MLPATVRVWQGAFSAKDWTYPADTARIAAAFHVLTENCDAWPSPHQFLQALKRDTVSTKPSTPRLSNDRINEVGAQHVKEILGKLHVEPAP